MELEGLLPCLPCLPWARWIHSPPHVSLRLILIILPSTPILHTRLISSMRATCTNYIYYPPCFGMAKSINYEVLSMKFLYCSYFSVYYSIIFSSVTSSETPSLYIAVSSFLDGSYKASRPHKSQVTLQFYISSSSHFLLGGRKTRNSAGHLS